MFMGLISCHWTYGKGRSCWLYYWVRGQDVEGAHWNSSTFAVDVLSVPFETLVCEEYKHSANVQSLLLLLGLVNRN